MADNRSAEKKSKWTFLTNHSHVLLCLVKNPSMRMREIALEVGITERAVQRIIAELVEGGFIECHRDGRCNRYFICIDQNLRHPIEADRKIIDLIHLIYDESVIKNINTV